MQEQYWFKRKQYGVGWTPNTWQGWLVIGAAVALIVGNIFRFEQAGYPETAVISQVVLPAFAITTVLVVICFKTGEPLKWSWGREEEVNEEYDQR